MKNWILILKPSINFHESNLEKENNFFTLARSFTGNG